MLKIDIDKTSEKVIKDPKRQERGKKSYEKYMKRLKEEILEDNQLPTLSPADGLCLPPPLLHLLPLLLQVILHLVPPPPPQDRMMLIFMVLVYLLPLPLVFVYFLHITLTSLKTPSTMKNKINNQKYVLCFRKIVIKNE